MCELNYLQCNVVENYGNEVVARASMIKELTLENVPGLSNEETTELKNYIACYWCINV